MSKYAAVTGASRGIGRATSISLAKAGWQVALLGRNMQDLTQAAAEIGESALAIQCDVSDRDSVAKAFSTIKAKFNRLDLLFNNAGVVIPASPLEEVSVQEWKQVFDINVGGVFFCTQEAFLLMQDQKPQGGRIMDQYLRMCQDLTMRHIPPQNMRLLD
jgi:NAD(P)-dependent dehydrogenase (short-subunit alcohol dehydrogenase family)